MPTNQYNETGSSLESDAPKKFLAIAQAESICKLGEENILSSLKYLLHSSLLWQLLTNCQFGTNFNFCALLINNKFISYAACACIKEDISYIEKM